MFFFVENLFASGKRNSDPTPAMMEGAFSKIPWRVFRMREIDFADIDGVQEAGRQGVNEGVPIQSILAADVANKQTTRGSEVSPDLLLFSGRKLLCALLHLPIVSVLFS